MILHDSSDLLHAVLQLLGVHCPDRQLGEAFHERDVGFHREFDDALLQRDESSFSCDMQRELGVILHGCHTSFDKKAASWCSQQELASCHDV